MEKDRFILGLSLLTLSTKYLGLVKNVLDENIKAGNPHILFGTERLTSDKYHEITKWSDFNISNPILFNLYHGFELLLKGFLTLEEKYTLKPSHDIEGLLEEFKKSYGNEEKIITILDKYLIISLMPDFLANCLCLKNNNIQIKDFYNFLRYPADKNFQNIYNYIDLKYQEEKGLIFFNGLVGDLGTLIKEAVKSYREIDSGRISEEILD